MFFKMIGPDRFVEGAKTPFSLSISLEITNKLFDQNLRQTYLRSGYGDDKAYFF